MLRVFAAATIISLAASPSLAGDLDFRLGTFGSYFCGAPATFEITSREPKLWVFYGMIRITDTGEYNKLVIRQYDDDSLQITRRLTNTNDGPRQTVDTEPPQIEGASIAFHAEGGRGAGCNNPGAFTTLFIPQ